MRSSLPALLLFTALCGLAQAPSDPQYEGSLLPYSYNGGYLLTWEDSPHRQVTLYGLDEKPAYSDPREGSQGWGGLAWAVDSDGVVARAVSSYRPGHAPKNSAHIDLLDITGKATSSIKTGSYEVRHIVFAPDHSLWTIGFEDDYERQNKDFDVIRHYTRSGELLGHSFPWSQITADFNAYTTLQSEPRQAFFAVANRLGYAVSLRYGRGAWIEIAPGGNVLGIYDLGKYRELSYLPVAMTESGTVYAKISQFDKFAGWAMLDRQQGIWRKVQLPSKGTIIGAKDENLIFLEHDTAWTVLHSLSPESMRLDELITGQTSATTVTNPLTNLIEPRR